MVGSIGRVTLAGPVALVLALGPGSTPGSWTGDAAASVPEAVRFAIGAGDALYATFDYQGAFDAYQKGLAADSTAAPLWWRSARCLTDRGLRATFDGHTAAAAEAFEQAVRAGRIAARRAPDAAEAHLELGIALGRLALVKGGKEKVRLSKEVRAEADRALLLNHDLDRAYHLLGRWNRGIAQLSFFEKAAAKVIYGGLPEGATMNNAVTYFEKAIELAPDYANHHLELGRTYLGLKLKDKARAEFERALKCPPRSPFDAEFKNEASALIAKTH